MPESKSDIAAAIADVRARAAADRRVFADPAVQALCARRWRSLFLDEAVKDAVAVEQATKRFWDGRPVRQRIADYFLVGADRASWQDEQPAARTPAIATTTLVACPGLLNGLLPVLREFRDQLPLVERRFGMRVLRSDSHPVRGCEANVADVLRALNEGKGLDAAGAAIPEAAARVPGDVFLLGYSKGAPDILTTLVRHPEVAPRVRALFTVAGAIGGSEVADSVATGFSTSVVQKGALDASLRAQGLLPRGLKLGHYAGRRLPEFNVADAVRDLTTEVRDAFLAANRERLDALNVPMFYLRGATRLGEVPWSQRGGFRLLSKFDPQNDMQVTSRRGTLPFPMATDLGLLRGHHWDLTYPSFVKGRWMGLNKTFHPFPKLAILVAIVGLASELGLID